MEIWEIRCDVRDKDGMPYIRNATIKLKVRQKAIGRIISGPNIIRGGRVLFETGENGPNNRLLVTNRGNTLVIDVNSAVKTKREP